MRAHSHHWGSLSGGTIFLALMNLHTPPL
jgi:hypothetical protein